MEYPKFASEPGTSAAGPLILQPELRTISLSPDEQLALWNALQGSPKLTPAQMRLGSLMRGEG